MAGAPQGPGRRRGTRQEGSRVREDALAAGLRYLAGRARSESEMRRRLRSLGHTGEAIEAALERLRSMGYLDDEAFAARRIARAGHERPAGSARIRSDLRRSGLSPDTIDAALRAGWGPEEETRALQAALESLTRRVRSTEPAALRRLASALVRRGFPPRAAFEAVGAWARSRREDPGVEEIDPLEAGGGEDDDGE